MWEFPKINITDMTLDCLLVNFCISIICPVARVVKLSICVCYPVVVAFRVLGMRSSPSPFNFLCVLCSIIHMFSLSSHLPFIQGVLLVSSSI